VVAWGATLLQSSCFVVVVRVGRSATRVGHRKGILDANLEALWVARGAGKVVRGASCSSVYILVFFDLKEVCKRENKDLPSNKD
jgi:hypothetical protein